MLRVSACSGLVMALSLGTAAHAAPEIPAAAFAALPQVSDVQLSPDGRLLAWRDQSGPGVKVVIFDIDTAAYRRTLTIDPTTTLRSLVWADDGTLLVNVSQVRTVLDEGAHRYAFFRTMAVDIANGNNRMLLMAGGTRASVTGADLVAANTTVPHAVVMSTYDYWANAENAESARRLFDTRAHSDWVSELFQVDTRTGEGKLLERGDQYTDQWLVNREGVPVARSEWRPTENQYLIETLVGAQWRQILERQDGQAMTLYGLSSDSKSVIAAGPDKRGRITLWSVAIDGSGAKDLLPGVSSDLVDVMVDRFSSEPEGVDLGGAEQPHWLDSAAEARTESVARAFPGRRVYVYSHSRDGSRVVAEVEDRMHPPVYYFVDFKSHRADVVGEAYPALDKVTLGVVRNITYAARDGTTIPAYLTLPPGVPPKGLPMVVLPHGGPHSHDSPDFFDWRAQFLAVRGYAVLQPEFRGSSGFGPAFERAGIRQWGGLMQDDVTDGVKAMIHQGIADPHRICIVGAGYGGYAALAGAAFTPDLYACAVSVNGISDLPAFLMYRGQHFGAAYGAESNAAIAGNREIGSPSDQTVIDHSPVNAAANIKVPILLLHSADDTNVPIVQSQEMADALARLGKPVTFVKLAGDDDSLSKADTRLTVLEDMDRFLHQFLN